MINFFTIFTIGLIILIPVIIAIELKVKNNILNFKIDHWRNQAIKTSHLNKNLEDIITEHKKLCKN